MNANQETPSEYDYRPQSTPRGTEHIVMAWRYEHRRYCGHVANCTTKESAEAALRLLRQ